MPRLPKTKAEAQQAAVLRALDIYIGERRRSGVDRHEIAESLGFSYSTLHKKMISPASFRLDELQMIANVLNISISRLLGESNTDVC